MNSLRYRKKKCSNYSNDSKKKKKSQDAIVEGHLPQCKCECHP